MPAFLSCSIVCFTTFHAGLADRIWLRCAELTGRGTGEVTRRRFDVLSTGVWLVVQERRDVGGLVG